MDYLARLAKKCNFTVIFLIEKMTDLAIYIINITCIALMLLLVIILSFATRLKGGAAYAAIIILVCNTSVYLFNMARSTGMYEMAAITIYPVQFNALLMPLMWLFVRRELDSSYRFRMKTLFHFIPSLGLFIFALIYFLPMSHNEFATLMLYEATGGGSTIVVAANDLVISAQVLVYFSLIFRFISRTERKLKEHYSDSDYMNVLWIKRVMIFFAVQFLLILIFYCILFPTIDVWFIPVMNLIASSYLVGNCITYPTAAYMSRIAYASSSPIEPKAKEFEEPDIESMAAICQQITAYLEESRAFTNPDLSLASLSVATGIPQKAISRSINGYCHKNFFDMINRMRVEDAKNRMRDLQNNYTVESIAEECGFRSRSSFYLVFKKLEGTTPARWLKTVQEKTSTGISS